MRETREFRELDDGEIRSWAHTEVGLSFITELKEARQAAVTRLITEAREDAPTAQTAGAIDILDRLLVMLKETP